MEIVDGAGFLDEPERKLYKCDPMADLDALASEVVLAPLIRQRADKIRMSARLTGIMPADSLLFRRGYEVMMSAIQRDIDTATAVGWTVIVHFLRQEGGDLTLPPEPERPPEL